MQHTATHCNTLQHIETLCNILEHSAIYSNTPQHTRTHCNTLVIRLRQIQIAKHRVFVCVNVYVCAYARVCTYVCMCVCVCVYARKYVTCPSKCNDTRMNGSCHVGMRHGTRMNESWKYKCVKSCMNESPVHDNTMSQI